MLLPKAEPKNYYGVTADAKAVAEVIRRWLGDNGRWNSPKYLGGESYGTTRSAAVANQLMNATYNDVALNGILLISTILDFGAQAEVPGNEMTYVVSLPSMAAVALYHGKAEAPSKEQFIEEARQFAIGPYASALLKGARLPSEERAAIRRQLARFTGLSETYLDQADLRVSPGRFWKELLRDRGLVVGRLDSRYTGKDRDNAGENSSTTTPASTASTPATPPRSMRGSATASGSRRDREYQSIGSVGQNWDWKISDSDDLFYLNVAPYLGTALRENSGLRIFVGQGYYDFATPFFGAEYSLSRAGIPQDRIVYKYYDAGHMMYVRDEDRREA